MTPPIPDRQQFQQAKLTLDHIATLDIREGDKIMLVLDAKGATTPALFPQVAAAMQALDELSKFCSFKFVQMRGRLKGGE